MNDLNDIKNFFFDLDKTLWNWDETIIGAEDTVDTLREKDRNVFFHTDNTLLTRQELARKLTSMGIPAEKEDILTSGYTVARHLEERDIQKVYALGEAGIVNELEAHDIGVSEDADIVVAGFDRQFSYSKLKRAMRALDDGELYICSTETTFRTSHGEQPHQGPTNLALQEFSDATLAGKPGELFRKQFKKYFSYFPEKSLFIGDRLADIEAGNRLGMKTAAVMSGDISPESLKQADDMQQPDYGISNLGKLKKRVL
ncbi:MAG: HAD-IIA family hydrolase [Candidatus Nanohaloarchaea archaeon]